MDFAQRIQEAQQYVDQAKGAYDAAKRETGMALADYNQSFNTQPSYTSNLEAAKKQAEDTYEVKTLKSEWEETKARVDAMKQEMDNLGTSVMGGFRSSGVMMTQNRYEKSLEKQNSVLSAQFKQYNADYSLSKTRYETAVEKAFNQSIDVANKEYDRYWNVVKAKYNKWQTLVSDEEKANEFYYQRRAQLNDIRNQQVRWQMQQKIMQYKRDMELWRNSFAAQQRNQAWSRAQSSADWDARQQQKESDRQLNWNSIKNAFSSGRMSASQFLRAVDSGVTA
jgi:hypothetical protein